MFCTNCGTQIEDGARFCPECGAKTEAEEKTAPVGNTMEKQSPLYEENPKAVWDEPAPAAPLYTSAEPVPEVKGAAVSDGNDTPIFVKGIVSAVLAWFPIASVVALIMGAINVKKADAAARAAGGYTWKTRIGRILSKVGFIAGIIVTVIYTISFIVGIFEGLS